MFLLRCQFPGPDTAETALQAGLAPVQPQAALGSQETGFRGKIHPDHRLVGLSTMSFNTTPTIQKFSY